MRIVLELTDVLAEKLQEAVNNYQDDGPSANGWASNELRQVRSLVDDAIESMFLGKE